jgi:hypothetical protein
MINLNLTIQEIETVLKHIEQSAVSLIDKIRGQAHPQIQSLVTPETDPTATPVATPVTSTTTSAVTN